MEEKKSVAHSLLFYCVVNKTWVWCYSWIDLHNPLPHNPCIHFLQHDLGGEMIIDGGMWLVVWGAVVWHLWRARNSCIFQGTKIDLVTLKHDLVMVEVIVVEQYFVIYGKEKLAYD